MRIKKIEAICKASRRIVVLWDREGECQWLGDGSAFYPVYGLPLLTEEHIFTMFDIPEDKRSKYLFTETEMPATYNFTDHCDSEVPLVREELSLIRYGVTLIPFKTSEGITFVDKRYLKPLEDSENEYVLCERTAGNGQVYIVAKQGFLLAGVIMPCAVVDKTFVEGLKTLHQLSTVKLSSGAAEPQQLNMDWEDNDEHE